MNRHIRHLAALIGAILILTGSTRLHAQSRIAEITDIEGVRKNIIRGVGLVIGLNNTGDKSRLSKHLLQSIMQRNSINASEAELGIGNVAVVMVTAKIDPFKRPGSTLDVTVSSLQDAESLFGGTLLETHLTGFDRKTVYAIAEGPIVVGGISAEGASGTSATVNHPTVGTIPSGALVEKEVPMRVTDNRGVVTFNLKNQNWKTAHNIAEAVNQAWPASAKALNAGSIEVTVPSKFDGKITEFIATVNGFSVEVDTVSKIIIDERTGVIVAGGDVRITTVAVAHGKLSVTIKESPEPVVAEPFTQGPGIAVVPRSEVDIREESKGLQVIQGGESVARLAESLNALGASSRQLIAILQTIKSMGALQAELEVR